MIFKGGYNIFCLKLDYKLLENSTQAGLACFTYVLEKISMNFFSAVDVRRGSVDSCGLDKKNKSN